MAAIEGSCGLEGRGDVLDGREKEAADSAECLGLRTVFVG